MAQIGFGLPYPLHAFHVVGASGGTSKTLNATGQQVCIIGHIETENSGTKTISAAGGGKIVWRAASPITFAANGPATTMVVSIQDVDAVNGPVARGDGTDDVSGTLTSGVDTIAANSWITTNMSSGSKTVAHGDLIAVNFNLTARNGADSVLIGTASVSHPGRPVSNIYTGGAWSSALQAELPGFYILFDDGTTGVFHVLDGSRAFLFGLGGSESFSDSINPDERGNCFQIPFDCKIGAFCVWATGSVASADFSVKLYSSPLTSPSLITSVSVLGEQLNAAGVRNIYLVLPSEITLSANTDYALTVRATGASNVFVGTSVLPTQALRAHLTGKTTLRKVTRDNDTGAFTEENPAITHYSMGVLITEILAGGGGLLVNPGMRGGMI